MDTTTNPKGLHPVQWQSDGRWEIADEAGNLVPWVDGLDPFIWFWTEAKAQEWIDGWRP